MSFGKLGTLGKNYGSLGLLGRAGLPAYTTGLTKVNTSSFRALVQAKSRNVRVTSIGNSTQRGQSFGVGISQAVDSWPMQLAPLLQTLGLNAGANNVFSDGGSYGGSQTIANFLLGDGRCSVTGAWALGTTKTAGGNAFACTATGSMTFTPQGNVTKFDIYWRDSSAGRNFTWAVDGGSTTQINSTGTTQIVKTTVSAGTLGSHALTLAWVLGTVTIIGIRGYDDTAGRVEMSFDNWAICGVTSSGLIDSSDTAGRVAFIGSTLASPDLALVEGGIINDWRTSVSVATSQANLTTLVQDCLAVGNVILCVPVFDNGSSGLTANQQAYVDAMYAVAAANGCGVFDIRKRWGSYANAVSNGWQTNSDTVHPTTAGYADIAAQMVPVIKYAVS